MVRSIIVVTLAVIGLVVATGFDVAIVWELYLVEEVIGRRCSASLEIENARFPVKTNFLQCS